LSAAAESRGDQSAAPRSIRPRREPQTRKPSIPTFEAMDSGLAPSARPGMTPRIQFSTRTLIFAPALTLASVFTSPSAFAQILQGLASLVSSPCEIGVRPKPMAMAWPSGQ